MSKPVHSKNEILRSNTGLTINPSKVYSRSETRDKLTGLTIIQGGLFRQSQAIKNRFPSRATGTPRLDEHMLIVFCMLLVSSVQVKHQRSDQSPRLSVSIPSRSSFKVHVKVHGFQIKVHGFSIHSIQVKLQGSGQGQRVQVEVDGFQYPFHPGQASRFRSRSTVISIHFIQVKHQGSDQSPQLSVSIPSRSSFKVQVKVNWSRSRSTVFSIQSIQEKHQCSNLSAMVIAICVKHQGPDRPSMCSVIRMKRQGPNRTSMPPAIQIKRQGPDHPSMVISIEQHYGHILTSCNILLVFSRPDLIYLQSPAIRIKHQDSNLPAMGIDLIYLQSPAIQSPAIQVELQGAYLPLYGYRPNSKDQNSNLGYSVFTIWLHNENFVFLPVRQVYTSSSAFSYCWLYLSTGFTVQASHHGSYIRPVLQSRPTTNHLVSAKNYRYKNAIGPLLIIVFVSLVSLQSRAEELGLDIHPDLQIYIFRWAVDYWLFLSVYCFYCQGQPSRIRSPSSMTVFSPPRSKNKDFFFIHGYSQGQSIQVYYPLGQTELPKFYYLPSARAEANDQSFDILLGSQQAFNAQLYIKGRRYTRIFKQFTKN
ncbi:hypothetical protein PHYBLDRAFT_186475 [Phycomyces blakesleeanus NRRL 1555(-)]|uniref:Uncharacterized protein n=1 Tax=Phycomyces blakesleeanus (strain ATCC 8743b / DSM 1359 / FGSC 10004 / NBRC 33097 / NRRL 1555) TaxID=763407 RepID=A0A162UEX6_PHYB8|nr:hypothetical protein PHYBLDRAFT_186475 [Phycomyces blakesleeanus NRRL 1555(-)]OAD75742.1 hypothetical protein PHYBLDRAFT_186475 [Phycomyces blakesleeanus NRRL 1555(-)]|eukprot:XP_018293782.1 hypothetical protein PHYBLDRAFT_186475 [Phycomyces blakesleeanus NRRL 1555(-)]